VTEENAGPRLRKYASIVEQARQITPWMDTMMEATVAEEYMNGVQALLGGSMTPEQVMAKVRERQAAVKARMQAAQDHRGETG
jgi:raffinose/stachyose/melibiose transport system substrate-binding protein